MLSNSELRRFILMSALAIGIAGAVLAAFAIAFGYLRQSALVLLEARRELALLDEERMAVAQSREALRRLEPERVLLASVFIRPDDPLPLIERIEAIGREAGVTTELAVSQSEGNNTYALAAAGSYENVMKFLLAIESFDFFLALGDAELRRAERPASPAGRPASSKGTSSYVRLTLSFRSIQP